MPFKEGERLWWRHEPRGGYGYIFEVPVTFVKRGKVKATVLADLAHGGQKRVYVNPDSLTRLDGRGQSPPV